MKIVPTATYNFHGEQLHIVDAVNPSQGKLRCFRCERHLGIDSFEPIFRMSDRVSKGSRFRKQALHPHCATCRRQDQGRWASHPQYSPAMDRFFGALTSRARGNSSVRGIVFAVTKDDVLGKFLEQDGKCALTGIEMDWAESGGVTGRGKRAKLKPSIDRLDSQGNYTVNNIQMVLSVVNFMKGDLTTDQFISLCDHVSSHRLMGSF